MQKLRIQSGNRYNKKTDDEAVDIETGEVTIKPVSGPHLDENDQLFLSKMSFGLENLEKDLLHDLKGLLTGIPIYEKWLKNQRGIGPTLAAVIISELDPHKAPHVSSFWKYCGLAVDTATNKSQRRIKGQKADFNPWLKSKLLKVMGDCLIRSGSQPWRKFYDDYKNRKSNTMVPVCMACNGEGKVVRKKAALAPGEDHVIETIEDDAKVKKVSCKNCNGTGGPAPWGCSDAHRHTASIRYMVKMFLSELHITWRTLEGLPVRAPYAEEYLGRVHHVNPHASANASG